ncbi:hypothetical protein Tco_0721873 [Tanacetum coccineum]
MQPTSKFTRDYSAGSKRNSGAPKKLTPKDNKFEQSQFFSPLRSEMPRNIRIKQEFPRSNLFTASKKATPIKFEPEIKRCSSFSSVLENKKGGSDMFANRVQSNSFSNVFENKNGGSDMFANRVQSNSFSTVLENKTGGSDTFANRVKSSSFSNVLESKEGGSDMFAHRVHSNSFSNVLENKPGGSGYLLQTHAFKYDDLDNQKRIMRLELGAEAVVKKDKDSPELLRMLLRVLIGRATEEWNVDIDMGREGRNCSVSRRQIKRRMSIMFETKMKRLLKQIASLRGPTSSSLYNSESSLE